MRAATQLTMGVLVACLAGCTQATPPGVSTAQAAVVAPASATSNATAPATSAADDGLAIALARERVDLAVREQTLHVQEQLRQQERQRLAAVHAKEDHDLRCIAGQRMRRVANGWVQAGVC